MYPDLRKSSCSFKAHAGSWAPLREGLRRERQRQMSLAKRAEPAKGEIASGRDIELQSAAPRAIVLPRSEAAPPARVAPVSPHQGEGQRSKQPAGRNEAAEITEDPAGAGFKDLLCAQCQLRVNRFPKGRPDCERCWADRESARAAKATRDAAIKKAALEQEGLKAATQGKPRSASTKSPIHHSRTSRFKKMPGGVLNQPMSTEKVDDILIEVVQLVRTCHNELSDLSELPERITLIEQMLNRLCAVVLPEPVSRGGRGNAQKANRTSRWPPGC